MEGCCLSNSFVKYDAKGQVVRDDHTTDDTKDRAFEFDGIGNRLKSADSLTLPATNNYVANALNQYSTALGVARPAASHDDDSAAADRGNLVDDGVKTYVWDGENRLLSVSDSSGVLVSYTYDYLSRRISKNETNGSNVTFIYDGWNPVAVYSGSGLSKTYTWGMDLSGSISPRRTGQGAGGVGGLLAVKEGSNSYYPTFDGNGNVSEYLDATGAVVAHYEYDAFGKTVNDTAQNAKNFVHRFSSKQLDGVGLYYYGYRYYEPEVGRWMGKDPIGEEGGWNLYGFVGNDGVNRLDYLGLWTEIKRERESWAKTCAEEGDTWDSLASMIGLEKGEAEKWVKNYESTPVPGKTYLIPNTLVLYSSEASIFTAISVYFREVLKAHKRRGAKEGYKVVDNIEANDAEVFYQSWGEEGIYRIFFAGHGGYSDTKNGMISIGYVADDDVCIHPNMLRMFTGGNPKYNLNIVGSYACGSATIPWPQFVSKEGGMFIGVMGGINMFNIKEEVIAGFYANGKTRMFMPLK